MKSHPNWFCHDSFYFRVVSAYHCVSGSFGCAMSSKWLSGCCLHDLRQYIFLCSSRPHLLWRRYLHVRFLQRRVQILPGLFNRVRSKRIDMLHQCYLQSWSFMLWWGLYRRHQQLHSPLHHATSILPLNPELHKNLNNTRL